MPGGVAGVAAIVEAPLCRFWGYRLTVARTMQMPELVSVTWIAPAQQRKITLLHDQRLATL